MTELDQKPLDHFRKASQQVRNGRHQANPLLWTHIELASFKAKNGP